MQAHDVKALQVSYQSKLLHNSVRRYILPHISIEISPVEAKPTKNVRNFCDSLLTLESIFEIFWLPYWCFFGKCNFRFEKIFAELESHVDERIASGSYNHLKLHLVPFVQKLLSPDEFSERLILTAAAILDNNCFEINLALRGIEMGGLFLLSLILCHDCVPNTKHFVNFSEADTGIKRFQMTFQTTGEVRKCKHLKGKIAVLIEKFCEVFPIFLKRTESNFGTCH